MAKGNPYRSPDLQSPDDGDRLIVGFRSRLDAAELPPGLARFLGNMRCDDGEPRPRKGCKPLSAELELSNPPVLLDFELGADLAVASMTRSGGTVTVTTVPDHGYANGDLVAVENANQTEYNGDWTITVTGAKTFTFAIGTTPATPATGLITVNKGPRIFDTYSDLARAACVYVDPSRVDGAVIATTDRAFVYRYGQSLVEIAYPAGESVQASDECDLVQALGAVWLLRGYQTAPVFTVESLTRSGSIVTATKTAHGLATGAWVWIDGATQREYNGIQQITVTGVNTFTYELAANPATPATGTITARPCKPALMWDRRDSSDFVVVPTGYNPTDAGLVRMPPVAWAVQFGRRLALPFEADEVLLSDLGDAGTYSRLFEQLKFLQGRPDYLVGALRYQEFKLLLLCRKSVHALLLDGQTLEIAAVHEIAGAVGCVARGTAVICGEEIFWLSDQGLQRMPVSAELTLRAAQVPLSDRIQDQFDAINWAAAAGAVTEYHDNRCFLAAPTGTSETNNTIFVYNLLNAEWESVDSYPGDFDVLRFLVLDYGGKKRLHAVTTYGFVYVLEELEHDETAAPGGVLTQTQIAGVFHGRYLTLGTGAEKRWIRAEVDMDLTEGDALEIGVDLRNPDCRASLLKVTATKTGDMVRRPSIKRRGTACSLEITTTAGRPALKGYTLEGVAGGRAANKQ